MSSSMNFQLALERKRHAEPPGFDALASVDWSFPERTRQDFLEVIHPYPAKFIPELPGTILDLLPVEPNTAVLDPFAGSGTTLVECQRRGISSIGVDLNPIACLISRVKTAPLPKGLNRAAHDVVVHATSSNDIQVPQIPNLDHWFEKRIQCMLARLISAIAECDSKYHDILHLALSSIIVRVSNQDSDTRYAAVRKNTTVEQVIGFFAAACQKISVALRERPYILTSSKTIERDTLTLKPSDLKQPVGAVITSPPYPNAYEYWLYHKYRMWWLGHDPISVKASEIGARAHFFKTNHHTAEHFAEQMQGTLSLVDQVLSDNGYACFIVGRSKIHGQIVDNAALIENAASNCGFHLRFKTQRVIASNRKSFNLAHANIKTETILIFTRRST